MGFIARLSALLLLCLMAGLPVRAADPPLRDLLFILDGSGSMWGQVDQRPKIVVAKEVLGGLIGHLDPAADRVGLMAYGHRRKGDCDDVETLAPIAPLDSAALLNTIQAINPKGKTPITRSVQQAVELLRSREDPATVVLVSDGLETCGGDPCQALREARAAGVKLVMHVVGFDVAEAETGQLRCMAEAGGGRYFTARNSAELSQSLEQAVQIQPPEPSAEVSTGQLLLIVTAEGQPTAAQVRVVDAASGREVVNRRLYPDPAGQALDLPPGRYQVTVEATALEGRPMRELRDLDLALGQERRETVDFGAGVLRLKVTANGELAEAQVKIFAAGNGEQVMNRRVYPDTRRNPGEFALTPGRYHVRVETVQVDGRPVQELRDLEIAPGGSLEREVDFSAGTLRLKVTANGELTEAQVRIGEPGSARVLVNRRIYPDTRRNPADYTLPPGTYDVTVQAVQVEGRPLRELRGLAVQAGDTLEQAVDFSAGTLRLLVTVNEELGEAQVRITQPGSARALVNQRIYPDARRNPADYELPPGTYDINVVANQLEGRPVQELRAVTIQVGETTEQRADFRAGQLRLTVTAGGELAEAQVRITPVGQARVVVNRRIYPDSRRNPAVYDLPPGDYDIRVDGIKLPGRPVRELRQLSIRAGGRLEQTVDLPVQ